MEDSFNKALAGNVGFPFSKPSDNGGETGSFDFMIGFLRELREPDTSKKSKNNYEFVTNLFGNKFSINDSNRILHSWEQQLSRVILFSEIIQFESVLRQASQSHFLKKSQNQYESLTKENGSLISNLFKVVKSQLKKDPDPYIKENVVHFFDCMNSEIIIPFKEYRDFIAHGKIRNPFTREKKVLSKKEIKNSLAHKIFEEIDFILLEVVRLNFSYLHFFFYEIFIHGDINYSSILIEKFKEKKWHLEKNFGVFNNFNNSTWKLFDKVPIYYEKSATNILKKFTDLVLNAPF